MRVVRVFRLGDLDGLKVLFEDITQDFGLEEGHQ